MKKVFTLLTAVAVSVSLLATTTSIWKGTQVLGAEGNDALTLQTTDVAALALNDYIAVTITDMTDTYCQLNIAGTNPWTVVPGTNWSDITEAGTHKYQIADADLLNSILTGGLMIQGKLCTLTEVAIVTEDEEPVDPEPLQPGEEKVLWEGEETLSWNEVAEQSAEVAALLAEKDQLLVTVSAKGAADWPKVLIRDMSSNQVGEDILLNEVTEFPYVATFTLSAADVQALKDGFKLCGDGVTVTKLVLKKYKEEDEPVDPQPEKEEVVLFEGAKVLGAAGEDNLGIAADKFASLAAKDSIVVTITDMTDTYCQLNIAANTGWVVVPGTNWESLTVVGRYAYVIADDDLVTAIKDGGITIQGKLCTITKVTLSPYVEPGDDPQPEDKPYVFTTVWTGDLAISWNQEVYTGSTLDTYAVKQDMMAGLAKDDSIKVFYKDAIEGAQLRLQYKDGDNGDQWKELSVSEQAEYFAYKVASEELAQLIADRGLVVTGQGYHAIRIEIGKPDTSTGIGAAITTTPARKIIENGQVFIIKDGIRYNILGAVVR